ncbi:MAG: S8 family serine peptidase [Gemmatimonadota bacterium]
MMSLTYGRAAIAVAMLVVAGCRTAPVAAPVSRPAPTPSAPAATPAPSTPAPATPAPVTPAPVTPPTATAPPAGASSAERGSATVTPARRTAPDAWHRLDTERDGVLGVGVDRALRELLAGRAPGRRVLVAVIDGGVDTAHAQLAPVLWRNPREVPGNGVDDDRNGFTDDVRGWSTIPPLTGDSGRYDTFELTRLYAACRGQPAAGRLARPDSATCRSVTEAYGEKAMEVSQTVMQIRGLAGALARSTATLRQAMKTEPVTPEAVRAFAPGNAAETEAKRAFLQFSAAGLDSAKLAEGFEAYDGQLRFGLDTLFNPRARPSRGSGDVMGPAARHGTHVAGIIAAAAVPGRPARGIAPEGAVTILPIRAVPDGDERDEEVARAIRYAVDQGALVINMSFGKAYSPGKAAVDSAVRYATQRGVLLVHAAGNDAEDTDHSASFPTRQASGPPFDALWIEVGASSWKGPDQLAAGFSNYGKRTVDLFAPGEDIVSTVPGGGVATESGTSMAAPVVSGVAALLLAYFPSLTPAQVRSVILETVRPLGDRTVAQPGDPSVQLKFGSLSRTGGLLDAYAAVRRAQQLSGIVP